MLLFLALNFAGLGLLSLATRRHAPLLFRHQPRPAVRRTVRSCAVLILSAGVLLAANRHGISHGLVISFITAGISGLELVFLLAFYTPRQPGEPARKQ